MKDNGSMNRIFRIVWNKSKGVWQAVAESSKGAGKSKSARAARRLKLAVLSCSALASSAFAAGALPSGASVMAGSGTIVQDGTVMTVNQTTGKMAIDWQSFSIGQGNSVSFVQPSASSVALNRVLGSDVSIIQGALKANGQVFLVNPNGVLFSPSAQVNVGGLVASTLHVSTENFLAGHYLFQGSSSNAIINQGSISAAKGGSIALIAAKITNDGKLTAPAGNVLIGAGSKLTLDLGGPVKLQVEQGVIDALIQNGGAIMADGGLVYLSAKAAGDLASTVINNTGLIEAQTLATGEKGQIALLGAMAHDRIEVGGKLDASAPHGGDGGFIETSAATVNLASNLVISTLAPAGTTGQWLIDPYDVVIAATGGNATGATIATALNSTNVTIDTTNTTATGVSYASTPGSGNGDITVNDAISKTSGSATTVTTLTLKAHNDININQAISSTGGRLNVVLTANQDASGTGSILFGASGSVTTKNGNFTAGIAGISPNYTVMPKGQDLTMALGSFIDVGTGNLDIKVYGNVVLDANSLKASNSTGYPQTYYNDGVGRYNLVNYIAVDASGSITTTNITPASPDILTSTQVYLSAASIGTPTAGEQIKISGPSGLSYNSFPSFARNLYISNTTGSSYVNEIGKQIFGSVSVSIGSQLNQTQNIQLMGDAGGNGTTGTGHIILNTDGAGLLNLATDNIKTGGTPVGSNAGNPSVFPTSVTLSAPSITFADHSVDTGASTYYGNYYSYSANFSATASGTLRGSQNNTTPDISAITATLNALDVGTSSNPVEVGGGTLNILNNGGSTYVKAAETVSTVSLRNVKTAGTHSVVFANGDHIDYTTNGSGILLPTIDSTPGAMHGVDLRNSNRTFTLNAQNGYIEFDTNSINIGSGAFAANIYSGNTDRNTGQAIYAKSNTKDSAAEITAGDVSFNIADSAVGSINNIEIAQGGSSTNNSLTVNTYGGAVDLTELSPNHFKSINLTLNGASVAQGIAIDLNGADDVHFSDSGSLLSIDGTKVNLSANNRNWNLYAQSRMIEVDGSSLSTGSYTLYAGNGIKLNGDILTNGGSITLSASGIALMKSVRIDSNADDASNTMSGGTAGSISLQGELSGVSAPYTLTVDSGSTDSAGNSISLSSSAGNSAGAYLSGLTLTSKGSINSNDGNISLYGSSYYLNGSFSSTGNSYINNSGVIIDTEKENTGAGGSIVFSGKDLANGYNNGPLTLNTATTHANSSGGNVDLYTYSHSVLNTGKVTITTTGGSGGTAGSINLPAINATTNGADNSQTYSGGIVTLHGDISTQRGDVAITGDTRLAGNVTIDTWQSYSATQTGTAGSVTLSGTGISAISAGTALKIDTSTNTGTGYFSGSTDWTHSGGAVSIIAGNAGGNYLGSLVVNTSKNEDHNSGVNGSIVLTNMTTSGNQTYSGGALGWTGGIGGDSIVINTLTDGLTVDSSGVITANSLLLKGLNTTYNLVASGTGHKVGTLAASGASSFTFLNNDVDLTIGAVSAVSGITASGPIDIATHSGNITIKNNLTSASTASTAIGINAAKDASAGTVAGGDIVISGTPSFTTGANGRTTLFTGSVAGSTGMAEKIGSGSGNFRYNSDEASAGYSTPLGSGTYALYREQPTITVNATNDSKDYSGLAYTGGNGVTFTGLANGQTSSVLSGTLVYGGTAQGAVTPNTYTITASGYTNDLGYAIAYAGGVLTINKAHLTVSADNQTRVYGQSNPTLSQTLSGFVNNENATSVTGSSTVSTLATASTGAGTSAITVNLGDLNAANYDFTAAHGVLTINKAHLTVSADNQTRLYGQSNPTLGQTLSGFVNGDNASSVTVTGSATGSTLATASTGVGTSTITGSVGDLNAANYDFSAANGVLTINKAHLTVTADNQTRLYGQSNPTLSQTLSGFVNGENASSVTGSATGSTSATASTGVGTTTITGGVGSLNAANYDFSAANGVLTINKAHLTVTADNQARLYGQSNPALSQTLSGFVNGENASSVNGSATGSTLATASTGVGTSVITGGFGSLNAANYDFTAANGVLTINKAPLTVSANADSKTDNGLVYAGGNGVSYSGLVNSESSSVLQGSVAYSGSSQGALNPGSYVITPSGLSSGNYAISYIDSALTLAQAPDNAAITNAQLTTVERSNSPTNTQPARPPNGVQSSPLSTSAAPLVSGGLRFILAPQENADGATDGQRPAQPSAQDDRSPGVTVLAQGGVDPSGFMRVVVVGGGVKLPDGALTIDADIAPR